MTDSLNSTHSSIDNEQSLTSSSSKNLLSSFYGLQVDKNNNITASTTPIQSPTTSSNNNIQSMLNNSGMNSTSSSKPVRPQPNPKHNLDSTEFDVNEYYNYLISNYDLKNLIEIDNRLIEKIIEYNNKLQSSVYNNYKQLINFTDQITSMNTDVNNMSNHINNLNNTYQQYNKLYNDSSSNKQENTYYNEYMKYYQIQQILKKFNFISLLPVKLKELIYNNQYNNAVIYIEKYKKLQNSNIFKYKLLSNIINEINTLITQFINNIKINIRSPNNTIQQQVIYIYYLIRLNEPSVDILFYDISNASYNKLFDNIDNSNITEEYLYHTIIEPLNNFITEYNIQYNNLTDNNIVSNNITNQYNQFIHNCLTKYYSLINNLITSQIDQINTQTTDSEQYRQIIEQIINQLITLYNHLQSIIDSNNDYKQILYNTITTLLGQLITKTQSFHQHNIINLFNQFINITSINNNNITNIIQQLTLLIDNINQNIEQYIVNTINTQLSSINYNIVYDNSIIYNIIQFFSLTCNNTNIIIQYNNNSNTMYSNIDISNNQYYILLLSQIIRQYKQPLLNYITINQQNNTYRLNINIQVITEQCNTTEYNLYTTYIDIVATQLTNLYLADIFNNNNHDSNNVSQSIRNLINTIKYIQNNQLSLFFDNSNNDLSNSSSNNNINRITRLNKNTLFSPQKTQQINKLFNNKLYIYNNTYNYSTATVNQLLLYIQRIVFKNITEYIRLHVYDIHHSIVGQIQIDIYYYIQQINIDNEIQQLLNELLNSLIERCNNNVQLMTEQQLNEFIKNIV